MRVAPVWLKPGVDFGPLAVFLLAYMSKGLVVATAVLMVATLAALVVSYAYTRKVALMPLVTAIIVGVFGGLTLWLQDDTYIKMKPTIIYGLFALLVGGGLMLGKPVLKVVLGEAFALDATGWRRLSLRFVLFFVAMALGNEVVRRVASVDIWVLWKVPGSIVLTFAFMLAQMPLINRHRLPETGAPEA